MPKPVYIICAAGLSEDRSTNLVTLFGIVESLVVAPVPIPDGTKVNFVKGPNNPGELGQLKVMAVWMKTSAAEDNVVFEHEFVLQFDDVELPPIGRMEFTFTPDAYLKRFLLCFDGLPPMTKDGFAVIRSRIRLDGGEWMSQEYPMMMIVHQPEVASSDDAVHTDRLAAIADQ